MYLARTLELATRVMILRLISRGRIGQATTLTLICAVTPLADSTAFGQSSAAPYFMATARPRPDAGNGYYFNYSNTNAHIETLDYYTHTASATATSTNYAYSLLHATSTSTPTTPGIHNASGAGANAGYRDFVTYNGSGNQPSIIRFNINLSGDICTSAFSSAAVGLIGYANGSHELENSMSIIGQGDIRQTTDGNSPSNTRYEINYAAYDSISLTPIQRDNYNVANHVEAKWHIDVPYDSSSHGYRVAIVLETNTGDSYFSPSGACLSDFSNTVTIDNISLTDGTVIDPSNLLFGSNLSFSPVPESNCLAAGGLSLAWLLWLRRPRSKRGMCPGGDKL